jgi:hypothetical protein
VSVARDFNPWLPIRVIFLRPEGGRSDAMPSARAIFPGTKAPGYGRAPFGRIWRQLPPDGCWRRRAMALTPAGAAPYCSPPRMGLPCA